MGNFLGNSKVKKTKKKDKDQILIIERKSRVDRSNLVIESYNNALPVDLNDSESNITNKLPEALYMIFSEESGRFEGITSDQRA